MSAAPAPRLDVVCLCAAWCGTCRDYEATFAALRQALPAHRYHWIDIEDDADAIGEIDVETFPTLLVAHQGNVLFAGPVLPRLHDAQRLLAVQLEKLDPAAPRSASLVALGLSMDQAEAYGALARVLCDQSTRFTSSSSA